MKRILALLLVLTLTLSPALAIGTPFADVPGTSWCGPGVTTCAQRGVMVGTGGKLFSPNATLSDLECMVLALRLHSLMHGGDGAFPSAPDSWGKVTLALSDGTVYDGISSSWWGSIHAADWGGRPVLRLSADTLAWGMGLDYQPCTLTVSGTAYPGVLHFGRTGENPFLYMGFAEVNGVEQKPEEDTLDTARRHCPPIGHWCRDAAYYGEQKGLLALPGFEHLRYDSGKSQSSAVPRWLFALTLSQAAGELEAVREVERIPDVSRDEYPEIYMLYEAGVLTGADADGRFYPSRTLTRAEAAVMVARILDESQRIK